jgi:hypothetical protein
MDRKPLARMQSRDVRITFRATADEALALRADADARDEELSRLIRRRLRMGKIMDDAATPAKAAHA